MSERSERTIEHGWSGGGACGAVGAHRWRSATHEPVTALDLAEERR